jgi:hypothetical protein
MYTYLQTLILTYLHIFTDIYIHKRAYKHANAHTRITNAGATGAAAAAAMESRGGDGGCA